MLFVTETGHRDNMKSIKNTLREGRERSMKNLFSPKHRPYYIYTPGYDRTSGGNKVMHLLCHALNLIGEECFMITDIINPNLRTPRGRHADAADGIVIYPELYKDNPLGVRRIVRYILSDRYKMEELDPTGQLWYFSKGLAKGKENVLLLPSVDPKVFNLNGSGDRTHEYKYIGRARGVTEIEDSKNAVEITPEFPETQEEIAEMFKHARVFYAYTITGLIQEAILCGCPDVLTLSDRTPHNFIEEFGTYGITDVAEGDSLAYAYATIGQAIERYNEARVNFWTQLDNFVVKTQEEFA
jgi:hypothetical protein